MIFHCWAVFPCFDQPDLKAIFKLNVVTNSHWQVVSNGAEKNTWLYTNKSYKQELSQTSFGQDIEKIMNVQKEIKEMEENIKENESVVSAFIEIQNIDWMLQHFMYHKTIKVVDFEETELLSTYLYTVNAGPYQVYKHVGGEVP